MTREFYFTEHALIEMDNDDLNIEDVMNIAETGVLIEDYPKDKPYPSTLRLGFSSVNKKSPIHVVSAVAPDERVHIITAYIPDPNKWDITFKKRKKN